MTGTLRPFFVVGCPRSGTTLVRRLLNSHSRISIPPESHFIPAFSGYGDPRNADEAIALGARILRLARVSTWGVTLRPEAFAADRTFAEVLDRLYSAHATLHGKVRWGDKTPQYVSAIPALLGIFPGARVVHVVRDGRDVALSWLAQGLEPRNLFTAATMWRDRVVTGRVTGAGLDPETYLEVRYERLLEDPEDVMRRICAHLGEPFEPAVLRPSFASLTVHPVGNPRHRRAINSENHGKWRTRMTRADRALFESVAGPLLQDLGYETEGLARRISVLERLAYRVDHRARWLGTRLTSPRRGTMLADFLRVSAARMARRKKRN